MLLCDKTYTLLSPVSKAVQGFLTGRGSYKTWQCVRVIQLRAPGMHRANTFHQNKSVHKPYHIHPAKAPTHYRTDSKSLPSDKDNLPLLSSVYLKHKAFSGRTLMTSCKFEFWVKLGIRVLTTVIHPPGYLPSLLILSWYTQCIAKVQFKRPEKLCRKNQDRLNPMLPNLC